ncbi:unnamed protein product [Caenorhabditis auriculariae]|uniref:Uncharacterized protein n=1 Tax=Caenorhabditis auriculariae TaxID=2777116 RepID=A0A8S1GPA7_9PELO|nr:unnamed protein product [Caenorhabditis auriculariae]
MSRVLLVFGCWLFTSSLVLASIFDQTGKGKCQPIEIALCKDLPYNYTFYPNNLLQNDQHTLQTHTEHFKPLMKTKCHPHIHFFICSVFAPMCPVSMPQAVTSCKSVCEQVKADCVSILEEFGIGWPEPLNCSQFPDPPELCMKPTEDEVLGGMPPVVRKPSKASSCATDLVDVDPLDPKAACAFGCNSDVMFDLSSKKMATFWFPERCVLYLSLSLLLSSLPYLAPLVADRDSRACQRLLNGRSHLVYGSLDNPNCLGSFVLGYFFSTAAALWWLMFSFTLYLSGGRKWVPEGIEACSSYVHFVAWGFSALATTVVLVFNKIDASELTGICSVGNMTPWTLLCFVIVPRTVCIVVGACFVVGGFASMCRERISFRQRGTDTSRLEKLMVKMGLFCALFLIPNVIEMVCQSYNYLVLTQWSKATVQCKIQSTPCIRPLRPQSEIYMTALLASLCTGVSCVVWVFSWKTMHSWKNFIFCGLCSTSPSKTSVEPSARPLLEPPTAPPPQPPVTYMPMTTAPQSWRPSKVL